jgi:phytoene dehydrogenase-like protein
LKSITIIGAGLGGLISGALLSKDGYKVTILEQHNIVGGCATTIKRKGGINIEIGLHEIGGIHTGLIKGIFDKLDVYNNVDFVSFNEAYGVMKDNKVFIMPNGRENMQNVLIEKFPNEKEVIKKYFALIKAISLEVEITQNLKWYQYLFISFLIPNIIKYKDKTLKEVINSLTTNQKLKDMFNSHIQYYSDSDENLSFLLYAVGQSSYIDGDGWFIKGGSQKLSDYLAKIITDNGGDIILKANVIQCSKTSVSYVLKKEEKKINSDIIISNLSQGQTYKLFGQEITKEREISTSLISAYIGFNKNLKDIYGARPYSNIIYEDTIEVKSIKNDINKRGFSFCDYSQIDSALTVKDKSFGTISFTDFMSEWENLTKEQYIAKKELLSKELIAKLGIYYKDIDKYIEFIEISTATTIQRYIKTPKGTAYGYVPTPKEFLKKIKSKSNKIKNLYFVGQWVICGGFLPSMLSGDICYKEIIKNK